LQIWDTAGSEKFRSITKAYFRGAHGIVLTFDLSQLATFKEVDAWVERIRESCAGGEDIAVVLVGNKSDKVSLREVTREEADAKAAELEIPYFETSAKDPNAANVEGVFTALARAALKRRQATTENVAGQRPQVTVIVGETQPKDECAC
jgi:small GTP-binding protein